jgi:hypothetical protein
MAEIATTDARALFTKGLIAVYQERIYPTAFLRSFFPSVSEPTKELSIEVERMGEKIAVDVVRGTEGNRNTFSRSTEKIFLPPLFREYFDATELDLYDRVLGSQGNAQAPLFAALLNKVADKIGTLRDKIERAYELQCAQVFMSGVVTLKSGANIDFKRKATSIVDDTATPWSTLTTDIFAQLQTACNFLRQVGRSGDGTFNAILSDTALAALLKNTVFLNRQNLFNMALDQIHGPQRGALGMTYHGTLTAGSYKVQLWAYPQFYDKPTGAFDAKGNPTFTSTPYIDPGTVVVIPMQPNFKFGFAAVPQLIGEPGQLPVQGEYVMGEFLDIRKAKHDFDIQSAGVPIPVAVDQIYTLKNVA